jgi:hypothetical protein
MPYATFEVEVTADLVERATQRDSQHCMIAEAIKRADPDNRRQVWVDLQTIRFTDVKQGKRVICLTPLAAAEALIAFDRGEPMEAFSFRAKVMQRTSVSSPHGRERLSSQMVIEGGDPNRIPRAHLGGNDRLEGAGKRAKPSQREHAARKSDLTDAELQTKVESGELTQIEASSKRYRRYGLRLLRA